MKWYDSEKAINFAKMPTKILLMAHLMAVNGQIPIIVCDTAKNLRKQGRSKSAYILHPQLLKKIIQTFIVYSTIFSR